MLETILERPSTLKCHRDVPLLKEREEFLQRLHQQGTSRAALRNLASELIHVVRLLRLGKLRDVSPEEIHRAAERFARQQLSNPKAHSYVRAASYFAYVAKKWLRFLGRLKRTEDSIRRPTGRLRSIHGVGTGTVAAIYPVKLLEGIEVSDMVRRATSIPGQREPQSCG